MTKNMEEKNDAQNYHVIVYCACWIEEFGIEMGLQKTVPLQNKSLLSFFLVSTDKKMPAYMRLYFNLSLHYSSVTS